jgi:hypothetical protein
MDAGNGTAWRIAQNFEAILEALAKMEPSSMISIPIEPSSDANELSAVL